MYLQMRLTGRMRESSVFTNETNREDERKRKYLQMRLTGRMRESNVFTNETNREDERK